MNILLKILERKDARVQSNHASVLLRKKYMIDPICARSKELKGSLFLSLSVKQKNKDKDKDKKGFPRL